MKNQTTTDKGYQKAFYLLKILHNYYITFLKKNYHLPVRLGFFCLASAAEERFVTALQRSLL